MQQKNDFGPAALYILAFCLGLALIIVAGSRARPAEFVTTAVTTTPVPGGAQKALLYKLVIDAQIVADSAAAPVDDVTSFAYNGVQFAGSEECTIVAGRINAGLKAIEDDKSPVGEVLGVEQIWAAVAGLREHLAAAVPNTKVKMLARCIVTIADPA